MVVNQRRQRGMSIEKSIRNAKSFNASFSVQSNEPSQYKDRMTEYFAGETQAFIDEYGKYAPDCVEALIQMTPDGEWEKVQLRFSEYVKKSGAITRKFDNYKLVMCIDGKHTYIPLGAKINTMGSIWIVTNPTNMSGADGKALIQRCNATWNFHDYYGNVVQEPICVEKILASANDKDTQDVMNVAQGYFNVKCQYNKNTAQLDTNSRIILGRGAYVITGYSDFEQQFTGNYDSICFIEFTVRYDTPNEELDDMINHIAYGKNFRWELTIEGNRVVTVGQSEKLTVESIRNGEVVSDTPQNPISYTWTVDDEEIATVNDNGEVVAIAVGSTKVKATLNENPNISSEIEITVEESENKVEFTTEIPNILSAYESCIINAKYYENGVAVSNVEWETTGVDVSSYSAEVLSDGSLKLSCWEGAITPLKIVAKHGNYAATAQITLEGL